MVKKMADSLRAGSCIYTHDWMLPGAAVNRRGELVRDNPQYKDSIRKRQWPTYRTRSSFPSGEWLFRRHLVCCYSFPWCTLIEIRSAQPITSIAGANASRYR